MGWHHKLQLSVQKQHNCLERALPRAEEQVWSPPTKLHRASKHMASRFLALCASPPVPRSSPSVWFAQCRASGSLRGAVVSWEQLESKHHPGCAVLPQSPQQVVGRMKSLCCCFCWGMGAQPQPLTLRELTRYTKAGLGRCFYLLQGHYVSTNTQND